MSPANGINRVLVTGGAGYVGSILVPKLLAAGYKVRVLDLYLYGGHVLDAVKDHPGLEQVKGDIRDKDLLKKTIPGCQAVIHLACISNDPSFELDPSLGKSINYDAFFGLVDISKDSGVERFIYASSSSVYGVKPGQDVTEELSLEPLTDYSKYKAMCEEVLQTKRAPGFTTLTLRPATVCGYSPRLRLDLAVNVMAAHAHYNRLIKVFGGGQMRPNLHIQDMTDLYLRTLEWDAAAIDGKTYNAGYQNHTVGDIALIVKGVMGEDVGIVTTPTDDNRSYHISSGKILRELGFQPKNTIENAVQELKEAFTAGLVRDPMTNPLYSNIKLMQNVGLH
jgi:nucleoside-diphosphate-sugar epimerase